jgi:TRAP-type mannitol/chloroaromatic compound transport system substrate-binding protein
VRLALLVVCCAAGFGFPALPSATGGESAKKPPRTVVLDSRFAPLPDTLGDGVQEFVDTLEAGAHLKVSFATPSHGTGILNAVNAGEVDLGIDILALEDSGNPALNQVLRLYGESVPFGPGTDQYLRWLTIGGGLEKLKRILVHRYGYHPHLEIVPVIANTAQAAGMSKIELTKANFQAGFLMRSFGFGQPSLQRAFPQMSFIGAVGGGTANIIAGFSGTLSDDNCPGGGTCELQAAEFVNPCIDGNLLYKAGIAGTGVRYYYTTPWQSPATISFLFYRSDRFTSHELAAIRRARVTNVLDSRQRLLKANQACLGELQTVYGQQIRKLPEDVIGELRSASRAVLQEMANANEDFGRLLKSLLSSGPKHPDHSE